MRTSTIVMMGVLGLAATPLALHLVAGPTGTSHSWMKTLHGGSPGAMHEVARVLADGQDKKPAPKAPADLTGKWSLTIENPQGNLVTPLVLEQDGRKLTGTFTNPHAQGDLPIAGEIIDGALTLTVDGRTDHDEMHIVFTGVLKDDGTLAGRLSSAMGEMTWTGVRTKDKK